MASDYVLITGGAGFIGSRVGSQLAAAGSRVVALDALHPQVHQPNGRPRDVHDDVELVLADAADSAGWDRFLKLFGTPNAIVHLAAETGTGQSLRESTRHAMANVVGTTAMLDAIVRTGDYPEHVVLSSSRAVYGEGAWLDAGGATVYPPPRGAKALASQQWEPTDGSGRVLQRLPHRAATVEPRPTNVYAATKLAQEHILQSWCSAFSVDLSVLRFQNVFGPGQAIGNSYTGVLTFFARSACNGQALNVFEDGHILRDFVFVDDVVNTVCAALRRRPQRGLRTLDVGSAEPTELLTVARQIAALTGSPEPYVSGDYRLGDVRAAAADVSDALAELGWAPSITLNEGLRRLVDWVRAEMTALA